MAKKKKQKKKLQDLSRKDLVSRRKKQAKQIEKLKKQQKTASKKEKKELRSQIKKKQTQRQKITEQLEGRETAEMTKFQKSLADFYESDKFKTLSPEQQEMIRGTVDTMAPEEMASLKINKKVAKDIANQAKEAGQKYFKKSKKRLEQDYEESLATDIRDLEKEQQRAAEDLEQALSEGDSYTAEQLKYYQRTLQDSVTEARSLYETEVARKNEYLTTQLSRIQEGLQTGLGQIDEDEAMRLKDMERDFTKDIDNLQRNMSSLGLAFSGRRREEEDVATEEYGDLVTTTSRSAQRARDEASLAAEREQADLETYTAEALEDLTSRYGYSLRDAIQLAEQRLGTGGVSSLIDADQQQYLVGDQTGDLYKYQQEAQRGYQRSMEDIADQFVGRYGTKKYNKAFKSGLGGFEYTPLEGIKGTSTRSYKQQLADLRQSRKDLEAQTKSQLRSQQLLAQL